MKHQWRLSGKKFVHDDQSSDSRASGQWKMIPRPGGWVVLERPTADGRTERVRASVLQVRGKLSVQWVSGAQFSGPYFGEWSKQETARGASGGGASDSDFTAQFPGKVRKVLVTDGAVVAENQKLILVEAMKMEFAIHAPCAGIVRKIRVTEGQQLSPGEQMVDFEAQTNGS